MNTTQLVVAHHHLDGVDFGSLGDVPKAHHALRIGRKSVSKYENASAMLQGNCGRGLSITCCHRH
jgi:hypothetical protein